MCLITRVRNGGGGRGDNGREGGGGRGKVGGNVEVEAKVRCRRNESWRKLARESPLIRIPKLQSTLISGLVACFPLFQQIILILCYR